MRSDNGRSNPVERGTVGEPPASGRLFLARWGGFQHCYANAEGMTGYRTRMFPEGSVVVVDWLDMRDSAGAVTQGPRRQVDVMVKDSKRFAATGGWGFQRLDI